MSRSAAILVGLLFAALLLISVLAFVRREPFFSGSFPILVGLAVGQLTLASAAVVFLPKLLPLRLLVQATVIVAWSWKLTDVSYQEPVFVSMLGVSLLATAWCAWLRFQGWRFALIDRDNILVHSDKARQQFSLATIMLVTTIFAIYLGLLRWQFASEGGSHKTLLIVCLILAAPAFLTLTVMARNALAWLLPTGIVSFYFAILWATYGTYLGKILVEFALIVLTTELLLLLLTLGILRVAGIYLVRPSRRTTVGNRLSTMQSPVA